MAGKRYQEGTVQITGKNKDTWTGYYYVYDQEGKRHRRSENLGSAKGVNRKQAMNKLRPIVERETSQPIRTTGEDTVEWYWKQRFAPFQKWSRTSRELVEQIFRVHVLPKIGHIKLKDVEKVRLQLLMQGYTGYSQDFIHKLRGYIKRMFEQAVDDELIGKNPMKRVECPTSKQKPSQRFLTMEEMDLVFAQLSLRDQLVCRMACVMGLRPGEIFGLTWSDYDLMHEMRIERAFVRGEIQDTKTKASTATIWVPEGIKQGLARWKRVNTSDSPYIFSTRTGNPIDRSFFLRCIVRPAAIRAGIMQARPKNLPKGERWHARETAVNFQGMRRSCATWAGQSASIKDVQAIMRHTKAETTLKYYQKAVPASVKAAQTALDARISFGVTQKQPARLQ